MRAVRQTMNRRFLFLLPLLTLAIMAGFLGWALLSDRDPASIGSVRVGRPAPRLPPPAARQGGPGDRRAASEGARDCAGMLQATSQAEVDAGQEQGAA